jgi:tRNA pseudouridine38-40 synthase
LRNLRLVIAYDGTGFHGWQRQPDVPTVQGCLEESLAKLTAATVHVWGSGRTDAGVHAMNQVANFKTESPIPCDSLLKALNNLLPASVRVKQVDEAPEKFHARYDVRSKTYRYRIVQSAICSPFLCRFVYHHPFPLDHAKMAEAAAVFVGEHDFTSFAGSEGRAEEAEEGTPPTPHSMVRTVFSSRLLRRPRTSMLVYEVRGSGFLHHMVRNIVGTLLEVGRGKLTARDVTRILEARNRTQAGPTAPAQGLCLVKVEY